MLVRNKKVHSQVQGFRVSCSILQTSSKMIIEHLRLVKYFSPIFYFKDAATSRRRGKGWSLLENVLDFRSPIGQGERVQRPAECFSSYVHIWAREMQCCPLSRPNCLQIEFASMATSSSCSFFSVLKASAPGSHASTGSWYSLFHLAVLALHFLVKHVPLLLCQLSSLEALLMWLEWDHDPISCMPLLELQNLGGSV